MPGGSGSRGKAPGAPFPQRPPLDVVFLTGALDAQGGASLTRLSLGHEEAVLCVRHYRPHSAGSRGGHARNIRAFAQLCSNLLDGAIHSQIGFSPPSVTFPGIFRRCLKTKGTYDVVSTSSFSLCLSASVTQVGRKNSLSIDVAFCLFFY